MKLQKQKATDYLAQSMLNYFDIKEWKDIISFAKEDISLAGDISSSKDRIQFDNYPYMIDILKACVIEPDKRKEVVLMGIDQLGKTTIQLITLLYNCCYNTLQSIVAYPSDQLAAQTATVKFLPLFKSIPQFQADLEKPFAIRSDRFRLSNALIYWQGAGTKIVSKSCKLVIGDECALWSCPNTNNINELKKRTRSYSQCLQLFLSTPRYMQDNFSRQFIQSSQGFYTLRCKHCGQLTMRSCDLHNLQFETVFNEELKQYICIRGSERLICPKCHYEHTEEDRKYIVQNGAYVHKFPDRVDEYAGFQVGALASLLNVHNWGTLADIQLSSGKSATLEDHISFDASIRGIYYQQRDYDKQSESAIAKHYWKQEDLKPEQWEAVYIAADTQDTFSPYGVFALDINNNIWCLEMGRLRYLWLSDEERAVINSENKRNGKPPETTLLDKLEQEYYGFKPLMLLVDHQGHRSDQIKQFASLRRNIIMYAGTSLKFDKWHLSDNNSKLFLCDSKKFQAELIYKLYFQQNRQKNYLFLPKTLTEKDIEEITSFQPDTGKRNGNLYENWIPGPKGEAIHDLHDVLKMSIVAIDISSKIFRPQKFKHYQSTLINKRQIVKHDKPKTEKKFMPKRPVFRDRF